ncbi:hypothetical protein [Turicibacter sanguinis]|uniref:hypothetical protein n=1 Tax=Turicibacter sanguinis TaxID=154288 RepID=UPI0012BD64FD|nr:hypothetical protein [Turicibacter sanguinis]MDB8439107.1 hypothetical protein [Turicibacter sanguinis]MTQ41044.1 hypothetical protein [Turicibacter sanguinis]
MLNIANIDSVLKTLALNNRYRFNAHQVAYLSGNNNIKDVYNYLISREPYVLYRRYEVQCPNNFDANESYASLDEIPTDWTECRICGDEFIPDKDLIQIVFYFTPQYLEQVRQADDIEKKRMHPLILVG